MRPTTWLPILLLWFMTGCRTSSPATVVELVATPAPKALPTPTSTTAPSPTIAPTPTALPTPTSSAAPLLPAGVARFTYRVLDVYPHDIGSFTQGLVYIDGVLYEGGGLNRQYGGVSSLRRVDLATGAVEQIHWLDDRYFGEGIAVWEQTIIQLTWQSGLAFVYDRTSFAPLTTFAYDGEGWGLTHDGERLIMSDGSATLSFRDPQTFAVLGSVDVRDAEGPVARLNELEYVEGRVLANIWQTDEIAIVDPATGLVTGRIDFSGLLTDDERAAADVLNGIAHDAAGGRLLVTGKRWPKLFAISLVPVDD